MPARLRRFAMALGLALATLSCRVHAQAFERQATLPAAAPPHKFASFDDQGEAPPQQWGAIDPSQGFKVARTPFGDLNVSAYALVRYLNQLPVDQTHTDHLEQTAPVPTRNDIQFQRALVWLSGFIYSEKLRYEATFWMANSAAQLAFVGSVGYAFSDAFRLVGGIDGLPGTRSMTGPFPYFFGTDRQLADDFFRPGFTSGAWATGALARLLRYKLMVGNGLNQLGLGPGQLSRDLAYSGSLWVMPTTGEFGPRGGFGDYELHAEVATRFGLSFTHSREDRESQLSERTPDNVQIRLTDSALLFETGALAPGVTLRKANYDLLALDAGIKARGFALHIEYYLRWLSGFRADGALPVARLFDYGFYAQSGYQAWPQKLEVYGVGSCIRGPFGTSYEVGGGFNLYPLSTRNWRLNTAILYVRDSSASSVFGYYEGGQTGPVVSVATDLFF